MRVDVMITDSAMQRDMRIGDAIIRNTLSGKVGFVRGYQFGGPAIVADSNARAAADAAYQARSERLQHKAITQPPAVRPLTDARTLANEAYRRKVERLSRRPR
jgi:hypothetical protein